VTAQITLLQFGFVPKWRRDRDSNPRYRHRHAAFRVRCFRPLSHLSADRIVLGQTHQIAGRTSGRARPLPHVLRFAKHKVDFTAETNDIAGMTENPIAPKISEAQFTIGDVVRHRIYEFRGVVFDIDPVFANSDDWYESIPEAARPAKDQPFYHLFAENAENSYIAYVSQQNLLADMIHGPVDHPAVEGYFGQWSGARYELKPQMRH
jgi:heat shock protein HspQ